MAIKSGGRFSDSAETSTAGGSKSAAIEIDANNGTVGKTSQELDNIN